MCSIKTKTPIKNEGNCPENRQLHEGERRKENSRIMVKRPKFFTDTSKEEIRMVNKHTIRYSTLLVAGKCKLKSREITFIHLLV